MGERSLIGVLGVRDRVIPLLHPTECLIDGIPPMNSLGANTSTAKPRFAEHSVPNSYLPPSPSLMLRSKDFIMVEFLESFVQPKF